MRLYRWSRCSHAAMSIEGRGAEGRKVSRSPRSLLVLGMAAALTMFACSQSIGASPEPRGTLTIDQPPPGATLTQSTVTISGTWKSSGGEFCYWARLKGFGGRLGDIIANDNVLGGSAVVTIRSQDKGFLTSGCGTWTRR